MQWWIKIQLVCFQAVLETLLCTVLECRHTSVLPACLFSPTSGNKLKMAERRARRGASIMEQNVSLWSPSGADDVEALLKEEKWIMESNFKLFLLNGQDVAGFRETPLSSVLWLSSLSSDCPLFGFGSASEPSKISLFAHVVNHHYK